jgi:Dolichyl-phosphate-mannose-protein mannosyltransferase
MFKREQPSWTLILCLAFLKFMLPLISQDPLYELQRDEFLYYQQGLHPGLGYLENPPLLSYLGTISSWFGGSESWIKFWPCLFGAATVVVTCLIAAELGGKLFAQFLAAIGVSVGAFVRVHYLFQPNFLDIFFWTLALYFVIRLIQSKDQRFVYYLMISLALSWWSKYSVFFIGISIMLGFVLSPHRKILLKKHSWLALLLGLVIVLPNLFWQYNHNWPLLTHMKELKETQLRYIKKSDFIIDQFMMLMPALVLWLSGLVWLLRQAKWRILPIIYFAVILFLLFGSGKGYYALGVYPMLIAAGAVCWERITGKRKWIRYAFTTIIIFLNWLIMPMLLPIWKPGKLEAFYNKIGIEHKWEDQQKHPLPQDYADMLGWKELTQKLETFYTALPAPERENTIILGSHYGHAGSIKFYTKDRQLAEKTFTDVGSFLFWIPDRLHFRNIILISKRMPEKDSKLFGHFENMTIIDSVTNPYSRQSGDKIIYFENIDAAGYQYVIEDWREMKKQFNK